MPAGEDVIHGVQSLHIPGAGAGPSILMYPRMLVGSADSTKQNGIVSPTTPGSGARKVAVS